MKEFNVRNSDGENIGSSDSSKFNPFTRLVKDYIGSIRLRFVRGGEAGSVQTFDFAEILTCAVHS